MHAKGHALFPKELDVPVKELEDALRDPETEARNWRRSEALRPTLRSGVPQFEFPAAKQFPIHSPASSSILNQCILLFMIICFS